MKRKSVVSVENTQHPLSGRRSSFKIKQTSTFFPKTNLLNRISQLSPEKITRSSSTKLNSRLGRSQYQPFQEPFSSIRQKSQIHHQKISQSKTSKKPLGAVRAFATNLYNNHNSCNETRISIITSIKNQSVQFENISYFAVYQGHNGNQCSTFLRDNLHNFIVAQKSFPDNISKAIEDGLRVAELQFMKFARKSLCQAGSSLVVAIVKQQTIHIANIGDCRAIASLKMGEETINLTTDHTPHNQSQFNRILKKGGSISKQKDQDKIDFYVLPGYKRVTRSIGDYYYKNKHYGIITNEPAIIQKKVDELDFILLGTNRLFKFTNAKQLIKNLWINSINDQSDNIHAKSGQLIKHLLGSASKDINSLGAIQTFKNQEPNNLPNFGD